MKNSLKKMLLMLSLIALLPFAFACERETELENEGLAEPGLEEVEVEQEGVGLENEGYGVENEGVDQPLGDQ